MEYLQPAVKEADKSEEEKGEKEERKNEDKEAPAGTWIDGKIIKVESVDKKYPDEDPV